MQHVHHLGCGCVPRLSRRGALGLGFAGALTAAFPTLASKPDHYDSMLLNCIDPRFTTYTLDYMGKRDLKDLYSQFVIAGGPIGVVAPAFKSWHDVFWENLAISVQLHTIKRVIGLTHRDCGAAAVAYGDRAKTDKAFETERHVEALRAFRAEAAKHQPKLAVETGIMALDGTVEVVT
ncbi:MAG TPA: hypothetical protein VMI56_15495 [Reyranella sp.]|nr:hypothetical protein [Reyranella sp.]